MEKRGEMTTKQIVTIIVLITSFIIVLFLLFRLNLGETSDKEICHNSVTLKAKTSVFSGHLDCKINYLCVSGGGSCEGITESSTVEVDAGNKTQIMEALAEEMVSCWWQFGEGKVDYADSNALTNVACSVCSIAGFDDSLVENSITYQEFYDYLQKTPKEKNGAETYLNYLYSTSGLANFENSFFISNYLDESIDPGKSYFIVTGMSKSSVWGLFGSNHLPVVIMEKTSANYDKIGCSEFLTKS